MTIRSLVPLAFALQLFARDACAQFDFPLTSFEQYLRVDPADIASPPVILRLADYGLAPGALIRIEPLGGFDNGPGVDVPAALMAVFSASATLLGPTLLVRVPDAIEAGVDYVTHTTCPGNLPTDIAQDFTAPVEGVLVEIPPGATHLFLCPRECYSRDNSDPNSDFGVRISLVSTGVGDHLAAGLSLAAPTPSPMRTNCSMSFALPSPGMVRLALFGLDGRRVRVLLDGPLAAGAHERIWDGRDERGTPAPAGVYFAKLVTAEGRCCGLR